MATRVKNTLAFDPRSISGLQLWLDAADANTLTLSASSVSQWRDKSTNLYVFTSPSPPVSGVNKINGLNVITNQGSQYLQITNYSQNFTTCTFFVVMTPTGTFTTWDFLGIFMSSTTNPGVAGSPYFYIELLGSSSPNRYTFTTSVKGGAGFGGDLGSASISGNTYLLSGFVTGNTATHFQNLNGSVFPSYNYSSGSGALSNNLSGVTMYLAGYPGITKSGQYAEIVMFNRILSQSEYQQVEGYLAWKWGLNASLPTSHSLKNQIAPFPYTITAVKTKNTAFPYLDPRSIPGCALWLDAADLSTLTYASGSNVSIWKDKTANIQAQHLTTAMAQVRNASSTGATNYPVSGYSINGVNALYFNQSILQAITTQNVTTRSYFFVFQLQQATSEDNIILWPGTWVTGYARGASFTASSTNLLYWSNQNVAQLPVNININAINPTLATGTFNN